MSNPASESPEKSNSPSPPPASSSPDAIAKPTDSGDRAVVPLSDPAIDDPVSQNLIKSNAAGTGRPRKTWRGFVCEMCHTSQADHDRPLHPRRGPNGPGTLCNRCGLKWRRQQASQQAKNSDGRQNFQSPSQAMNDSYQLQAMLRAQARGGHPPLPPGFPGPSSPLLGYNASGPVSPFSQMSGYPTNPNDQMQLMAVMYQQYQLQMYLYQLQQAQAQAQTSSSPLGASASSGGPSQPLSVNQYMFAGPSAGASPSMFPSQPAGSAFSSSQPSSSSTLFSSSSTRRREGLPPATLPTPAQQSFSLFQSAHQQLPTDIPSFRFDQEDKLTLHSMNHEAT